MSDYLYAISTAEFTFDKIHDIDTLNTEIKTFLSEKQALCNIQIDARAIFKSYYDDDTRELCLDITLTENDITLDVPVILYEFNVTNKDNVYVERQMTFKSYIERCRHLFEENLSIIYSNPNKIDFISNGGLYSINGEWCSIVNTDEGLCRFAIETVVISRDECLCNIKENDGSCTVQFPISYKSKLITDYEQALNNAEMYMIEVHPLTEYTLRRFESGEREEISPGIYVNGTYIKTYTCFLNKYKNNYRDDIFDMTFKKIFKVMPLLNEERQNIIKSVVKDTDLLSAKDLADRLITAASHNNINEVNELISALEQSEGVEEEVISQNAISTALSNMGQGNDFESELPEALPCFTPDEMEMLGVYNINGAANCYGEICSEDIEWFNHYKATGKPGKEWLPKVKLIYQEYVSKPTAYNKQHLLELGWNPEIALTNESIIKSTKITAMKLNESHRYININLV